MARKVINVLGFLITSSVILIISRGKIPKFPMKLRVVTFLKHVSHSNAVFLPEFGHAWETNPTCI
jgi:hypothetical protein